MLSSMADEDVVGFVDAAAEADLSSSRPMRPGTFTLTDRPFEASTVCVRAGTAMWLG